ncbi:DEAD/DEAH box helicase [Paraglaciecola sp.]|uniref:DEAD/DEAH box helicase n=1 Tax=Paraglaciecola sp. TaxID=1920173 RepID=UPI003EF2AD69
MSFGSLGLCDALVKTVEQCGYAKPSQIQIEAIPAVLRKQDVMAVAQTGTGKTASFVLPMLQLLAEGPKIQTLQVRGLIITPTRELAAQVAKNVLDYSQNMELDSCAVHGGVRIEPQISKLQLGLDILVATPGRLVDLYNQGAVKFDQLEMLVLDEADRMLDLGFVDDIRHIQTLLPAARQTLMFSATFSPSITSLAKGMLNNPTMIEVASVNSVADTIQHKVHPVDKERKNELLIHLLKKHQWQQVLVFSRTKQAADNLVVKLEKVGIQAASIHANRTQHARTQVLDGFRNGTISVLIATDIASRGIDVNQLPSVINLDLPYVAEDYVHRIGRTGRVGSEGLAISLFSEDETKQLKAIERAIGQKLQREMVPGFAPSPRKKLPVKTPDEDLYGNFEADTTPRGRKKSKGRRR